MTIDPESDAHRRFNPLTGQWVLVSPHRTRRPWQGQTEAAAPAERRPRHDPACYLCPGNRRAQDQVNPAYPSTFVFDNDFSALVPAAAGADAADDPAGGSSPPGAGGGDGALFRVEPVSGSCRVICFSPRHDLTLAELDSASLSAVIETWVAETARLGQRYRWVQVFENKGAVMGCSNPHPHGQIWASSSLPVEAAAEDRQQRHYLAARVGPSADGGARPSLLVDYARAESERGVRVVCENEAWLVVVPFWAVWPFETLLLPRRPVQRLPELSLAERGGLARILAVLLGAYDRLFDVSFPYSMGWHGAPFGVDAEEALAGAPWQHWQLHAHVYPPLLRSATVKKFMVGYEMLAEPQRDMTPEQAARRLRDAVTQVHHASAQTASGF